MSRPKRVWVLHCLDLKGFGLGSRSEPKMGLGVGPSCLDPRGLGDRPVAGPNGVEVWVLPWSNQGVFVLGLRFASGPKTSWV
jgi:hypothetical protein